MSTKEKQENVAGREKEFLEMAAEIEGIYVPAFYDVTYKEDGTIESFRPNNSHAKEKIKKQVVMDMTGATYPEKPVVPFIKQHRIESFLRSREAVSVDAVSARPECLYRPTREKDVEVLKRICIQDVKEYRTRRRFPSVH